jgi:hypothetical protein
MASVLEKCKKCSTGVRRGKREHGYVMREQGKWELDKLEDRSPETLREEAAGEQETYGCRILGPGIAVDKTISVS